MSNNDTASSPEDFDLFATPVDTHLAEELAKGTFEWTNKYTKILGVLTGIVALLSLGAWYGHHAATSSTTANASSLRSTFSRLASSGAFGGGASGGFGGGSGGGGFGGGSFGTRINGSIAKVSGNTVTITLADPTQAASLKAGDNARITDTGSVGASGGFAGAAGSTGSAGSYSGKYGSGSSTSGTATGGSAASGAMGGTPATGGAAAGGTHSGGTAGAAGGAGHGGGLFTNPAFTACMTKAGITLTPGQRPNFQDPNTAAALQSCMKSLGITFGGGGGGGGGGGYGSHAGGGAATGGSSAGGAGASSTNP